MKSTFLAATVIGQNGLTKVTLKDVNGGDGLNDFRAGSRTGDVVLDIYGAQSLFEPGKTYVLDVKEFDPAAIEESSDTAAALTEQTTPTPAPLSVVFNALVTVGVDETGTPTLNIDATPVVATLNESEEETANTQVDNGVSDNTDGESKDTGSATDNNISDVSTNTQGNAGAAAGTENTQAADNLDNNPDPQADSVDGKEQVS